MAIRARRRVRIPAAQGRFAAALGPPGAGVLPIAYVTQSENNWCWAACGEMLLGQAGHTSRTQCDLASHQFSLVCCPSPGAPAGCDQGCWPDMCYPSHGLPTNFIQAPLTQAQLQTELRAGRPVQACYQWTRSQATHVALIVGEHANGDFEVFDPWSGYGRGPRSFAQVQTAYGLGAWIYSFTF